MMCSYYYPLSSFLHQHNVHPLLLPLLSSLLCQHNVLPLIASFLHQHNVLPLLLPLFCISTMCSHCYSLSSVSALCAPTATPSPLYQHSGSTVHGPCRGGYACVRAALITTANMIELDRCCTPLRLYIH